MKLVAIYPVGTSSGTDGVSSKPVIDFLVGALHELGVEVQIISLSLEGHGEELSPARDEMSKPIASVVSPPAELFGTRRPKGFGQLRLWWWLTKTLLKSTERGEQIIVYHSMRYIVPIFVLKLFKRIRVLLYVGEFFQTLYPMSRWKQMLEKRYIAMGDAYIFVTRLLVEQVSKLRKQPFEYALLYGPYRSEENVAEQMEFSPLTRLLYVGKISSDKGIDRTLALAKYLDSTFEIRIVGYCEQYSEDSLLANIAQSNEQHACKIYFDGLKYGDEYIQYVQHCQLGLVLQDMDATYNTNSFPSKVLSFLANGLEVIAPNIPTIGSSPFVNSVYLYEDENPANIAEIIKTIDLSKKRNDATLLDALREEFVTAVGALIAPLTDNR